MMLNIMAAPGSASREDAEYSREENRHRGNWRQLAACRSAEPELFFPAPSVEVADMQTELAKAFCLFCPVRRECLQFALATRQTHGVWGGMSERERTRAAEAATGQSVTA
jgi:WhiB family redox-sensing transcriptional regulator